MKSVTKTYSGTTIYNTTVGLSTAQRAGLYNIVINGSTTIPSGSSYTFTNKIIHVHSGPNGSSGCFSNADEYVYAVSDDTDAHLRYIPWNDTTTCNTSSSTTFTGTITFYYFG